MQDAFTDPCSGRQRVSAGTRSSQKMLGTYARSRNGSRCRARFRNVKAAKRVIVDGTRIDQNLGPLGIEYVDGDFRTRAPVVVLTGIELFAGFSLDDAWKKAGGEHAQFGEARGL